MTGALGSWIGRAAPPAVALAVLASSSAPLAGCAPPAQVAAQSPTAAELRLAHERLAALRAALGERTEEIRVSVEAPLLPGEIRARGAVAVVPGRAARMILVGPGGGTAVDLWMDRRGHRVELPSREQVVRGRRGEPAAGVPVELLRGWFLEPFEGELLHAAVDPKGMRILLRTEDAMVRLDAPEGGALTIERTPRSAPGQPVSRDVETIRAAAGAACGLVVYERLRTGVRASITCERRRPEVAPRALVDPDRVAEAGP